MMMIAVIIVVPVIIVTPVTAVIIDVIVKITAFIGQFFMMPLSIIPGIIPASPPAPYSIPMQALIGAELTNLCVMEVE